jgi:hypothetical protein
LKNHLVFYNWQLNASFYGIMIDHMEEILLDSNNRVILLTCDGKLNNCLVNKLSHSFVCEECKFIKKIGLTNFKKFGDQFIHLEIGDIKQKSNHEYVEFKIDTIQDVKKIKYRDVYIGYGALSSYVSYTRNLSPNFDDREVYSYFKDLLISQMNLADVIYILCDKYEPEKMHVYNGRWADVRPMFDVAKFLNIDIDVLEAKNDFGKFFYKLIYPNVLPQNIKSRHNVICDIWEMAASDPVKRLDMANSFFYNARNARNSEGAKIFTKNQLKGQLPLDWDHKKRNVVIFNSSEDEFVALGKDYDAYALFVDQEQGIRYILNEFKGNKDVQFYLRIHPNLAEVTYGYHTRLIDLEKEFQNISVIPGNSAVSSYSLIDSAQKIIAFTSTIGVEACFWGKPTILLSGAGYYYLDVAYIPKERKKIKPLILADLKAKDKIGALKYGYFLLDKQFRTQNIRRNPNKVSIFGKELGSKFSHLKLLNSSLLFRVCWQVWIKMLKPLLLKFSKSKYKLIPVKEKILSDD